NRQRLDPRLRRPGVKYVSVVLALDFGAEGGLAIQRISRCPLSHDEAPLNDCVTTLLLCQLLMSGFAICVDHISGEMAVQQFFCYRTIIDSVSKNTAQIEQMSLITSDENDDEQHFMPQTSAPRRRNF